MRRPALIAVLLAHVAAAGAEEPRHTVWAVVLDQAGRPLPHVLVFAAEATRVIAVAHTSDDGSVVLPAPHPRYNFGLMSATLRLAGVTPRGGGRFELTAAPLPPAGEGADHEVVRFAAPRAEVLRGRVVDETGAGLAGVRVEAVRDSGLVASTTFTRPGGRFALVVPGGDYGLRASAPGLYAASGERKDGVMVVVMAVASAVQAISVTDGHVLSFRPSDSIDPEYTPPAPVRAWLRFAYGICPASGPLRAHERRGLKKYWYLDVLRREPPNPATISTVSCASPTAVLEQLPAGQARDDGFEVWQDAVVTRPTMPPPSLP